MTAKVIPFRRPAPLPDPDCGQDWTIQLNRFQLTVIGAAAIVWMAWLDLWSIRK